jgi:myo-inositol-1(or 4)-monophosphatase
LAVRLAHVASGVLDAGLAGGNSHDWDIAAADLILHEAGALLTDRHGTPPAYNRPSPIHPALIAAPPVLHRQLVALLARPGD